MSRRPVPPRGHRRLVPSCTDQRRVRRDLVRYRHSIPDRRTLLPRAAEMRSYHGPVPVVWGAEGRLTPAATGELAGLFTDAKLVEIEDSCTLIPEDQPERLARELREFVKA